MVENIGYIHPQLEFPALCNPNAFDQVRVELKERRALDVLFVTELTDREIILGKLGSRLAYMGGVVLTSVVAVRILALIAPQGARVAARNI